MYFISFYFSLFSFLRQENSNLGGFEFRLNPSTSKKEVSTDGGTTWVNFSSGLSGATHHEGNHVNKSQTSTVTVTLTKGTHTIVAIAFSQYLYRAQVQDRQGVLSVQPDSYILQWENDSSGIGGPHTYVAIMTYEVESESMQLTYSLTGYGSNEGVYFWTNLYTFDD